MTIPSEITPDDILDSRDVIARIDWLGPKEDCDPDDLEELEALLALQDQAEGSPDWSYGEALIADSYFETYTQTLVDDCFDIPTTWPGNCIDWKQAARELQIDYFEVEFMGHDYWIRG